jgi:hypothetical protein
MAERAWSGLTRWARAQPTAERAWSGLTRSARAQPTVERAWSGLTRSALAQPMGERARSGLTRSAPESRAGMSAALRAVVARRRAGDRSRSSHHSATRNGIVQPSHAAVPDTIQVNNSMSPWNVVSICGDSAMKTTAPQIRFEMDAGIFRSDAGPDASFNFGLTRILDGVEKLIAPPR